MLLLQPAVCRIAMAVSLICKNPFVPPRGDTNWTRFRELVAGHSRPEHPEASEPGTVSAPEMHEPPAPLQPSVSRARHPPGDGVPHAGAGRGTAGSNRSTLWRSGAAPATRASVLATVSRCWPSGSEARPVAEAAGTPTCPASAEPGRYDLVVRYANAGKNTGLRGCFPMKVAGLFSYWAQKRRLP